MAAAAIARPMAVARAITAGESVAPASVHLLQQEEMVHGELNSLTCDFHTGGRRNGAG
jgi:hypothetical protein